MPIPRPAPPKPLWGEAEERALAAIQAAPPAPLVIEVTRRKRRRRKRLGELTIEMVTRRAIDLFRRSNAFVREMQGR